MWNKKAQENEWPSAFRKLTLYIDAPRLHFLSSPVENHQITMCSALEFNPMTEIGHKLTSPWSDIFTGKEILHLTRVGRENLLGREPLPRSDAKLPPSTVRYDVVGNGRSGLHGSAEVRGNTVVKPVLAESIGKQIELSDARRRQARIE